jgi:hypothetical protein
MGLPFLKMSENSDPSPVRSPAKFLCKSASVDGDMGTAQLRQQLADFGVQRGIQIQLKLKFTLRLRGYLYFINHDFSPREFRL